MNDLFRVDTPKPKWFGILRWGWFVIASWGLLGTPFAIRDAVHLVLAYHRLFWIIPIAFVIRAGQIFLFYRLWWRYRPSATT